MIDFKKLIEAGVHFGHQASRWVPKMDPYIWGVKNKVHLIDVSKTALQLEKAAQFLEQIAAEGKQILWVGTKKAARDIIKETAESLEMPYVDYRWVGGTLSNYAQVKKSVTRLLHYEDVLARAESYPHYTKKELNKIRKNVERLQTIVGGIKNLTWPLGAIVIVDVNKEQSALKEAASVGVPVVALVDTNADPSLVDYVIPSNDDAPRAIRISIDYLKQAVEDGLAKKKKAAQKDTEAEVPAKPVEASKMKEASEEEEKKVEQKKETKSPSTKKEADTQKVKPGAKSAVKKEKEKEEAVSPTKTKSSTKSTTARKPTSTTKKTKSSSTSSSKTEK